MTSLGLPNLVSVTIGTRIFKKKFKKWTKTDFFKILTMFIVILRCFYITYVKMSYQCRVPLSLVLTLVGLLTCYLSSPIVLTGSNVATYQCLMGDEEPQIIDFLCTFDSPLLEYSNDILFQTFNPCVQGFVMSSLLCLVNIFNLCNVKRL